MLKVKVLPRAPNSRRVFITGGTGYMGSELIPVLLERGHRVRALVRPGSKAKLSGGCEVVSGDPIDANSYRNLITPADTFIHLVGVPRPSPAKGKLFRSVDLVAAREAIQVAAELHIPHFIYLSVAHPAPVMKTYIEVRSQCEELIREHRLNSTILRPWYVLGPGHRWPIVLIPMYKAAELLPMTRAGACRLGLVTIDQMVMALAQAVESPTQGIRIVEVPEIRDARISTGLDTSRQTA